MWQRRQRATRLPPDPPQPRLSAETFRERVVESSTEPWDAHFDLSMLAQHPSMNMRRPQAPCDSLFVTVVFVLVVVDWLTLCHEEKRVPPST